MLLTSLVHCFPWHSTVRYDILECPAGFGGSCQERGRALQEGRSRVQSADLASYCAS